MPDSNNSFALLTELLRELFQLDRGDLDFGIYRIMNLKSAEIQRFLEHDLLPQVKSILQRVGDDEIAKLNEELNKSVLLAKQLGFNPDDSEKINNLRQQLEEVKSDKKAESDVYNHLIEFFSRYYSEGDFLTLRRYTSKGKSAFLVPYDGEEIKLHWANSDQYYIKSSENFGSYIFTVDDGDKKRRVRFETAHADIEKDDIQSTNKRRRFVLAKKSIAVDYENQDLIIRFEHRPLTDSEKKFYPNSARQQERLNSDAVEKILSYVKPSWTAFLAASAPTQANGNRTLLDKHLASYTAKNSSDYFIHKDLGNFLQRELEFYLKTEVLNLDELSLTNSAQLFRALARMRAVQAVGNKIITFLTQFENFEKKLWLKKKFVLDTEYLITLDLIPETFYEEIASNSQQFNEWVELYAVDEINNDLVSNVGIDKANNPNSNFLRSNPHLVLDTKFFSGEFKDKLLAEISKNNALDELMDGLLIHGDNYQGLNLLKCRYRGHINCIYIDPPYNTKRDDFIYKNGYKRSSWLSLIKDRTEIAKSLLTNDGIFMSSIDEHESANLRNLCEYQFGSDRFAAELIWNTQHSQQSGLFAPYHEYIQIYTNCPTKDRANFTGGKGEIVAGALKKPSVGNPPTEFTFPEGVKWEAKDGTELTGAWGDVESVELVEGRMVCQEGKLKYPVTLKAGWTQKRQMEKYFAGDHPVIDSKGQEVTGFYFSETGKLKVTKKRTRITPNTILPNFGTVSAATKKLKDMFGSEIFGRPKPVQLIEYLIKLPIKFSGVSVVLDYFAGSGTTGHAVINLNRLGEERSKYILIEVGHHFDNVIIPRIKKAVYSDQWKDGKPVSRNGTSQFVKYIEIESYEDTLDGLEFVPTDDDLLSQIPSLAEDFRLRYALVAETSQSTSLLGNHFSDPFAYTLSVVRDGERREISVDLPETFNYLIGLRTKARRMVDEVLAITGRDSFGQHCLILWRNLEKTNNAKLESWLDLHLNTFNLEFDRLYVNGDHTLNAKRRNQKWVAKSIEPVFRTLMFDLENETT